MYWIYTQKFPSTKPLLHAVRSIVHDAENPEFFFPRVSLECFPRLQVCDERGKKRQYNQVNDVYR
jgi:hypothetical protein